MATDLVGLSFKKFRKAIRKAAPVALFPPAAAFKLVSRARRKPAYRAKIQAVKQAALTPPEDLIYKIQSKGSPMSLEDAQKVQAKAMDAYSNIRAAYDLQNRIYEETNDPDAYDFSPDEDEGWGVEGDGGSMSLYDWGALAGDIRDPDIIGFSIKKALRKLGRTIDPTKAGSPFGAALQSVPGIGPQLKSAADMVAKARAGSKEALAKIQGVKDLAKAGDPKGKEALDNLKAANAMSPPLKLARIFSHYEYGARVAV